MTLNPVESLNTFSRELKNNLRQRSYSQSLVRTRAPFLRFTTGANMSELQDKLGNRFAQYSGYDFFTLGLHGWDNFTYKDEDIYGTKSSNGLICGLTYKNGQQKIVYTHGTRIRQINGAGEVSTIQDGAQNYPPPGITSVKVERLRNGNVLRATIDITVHTQEQLELLDAVCFVPGMTCIIEWGSMQTTPSGPLTFAASGLQTLDFTNPSSIFTEVQYAKNRSRKDFIERWCLPNSFNYDWVVANIANVKTKVENNAYKVSVIAYARADNIMYISAYATTSTLTQTEAAKYDTQASSVNYYFRLNGEFSSLLKNIVRDTTSPYRDKVLSFVAPMDQAQLRETIPTSQTYGVGNELGFEDTFFISFDTFIDLILNRDVAFLINRGLPEQNRIRYILAPLSNNPQQPDAPDSDTIPVGYNEHLRSIDPQVLIIYNKKAILAAKERTTGNNAVVSGLQRIESTTQQVMANVQRQAEQVSTTLDSVSLLNNLKDQGVAGTTTILDNNQFGRDINTVSDTTNLLKGVFINSKAIQSAFINARTVYEGLDVLLRNINAATENYWNLKVYYDDDKQSFRILDDNVKLTRELTQQNPIYEFNKALTTTQDDLLGQTTIGPDVINIDINTDYPKLVFSKLATSAINGGVLATDADRTDVDFNLGARVGDVFVPTTIPASEAAAPPRPPTPRYTDLAALTSAFKTSFLARSIDPLIGAANFSRKVVDTLNAAFAGTPIAPEVAGWISTLMDKRSPLTVSEATQLRNELRELQLTEKLTTQGYVALMEVAKLRSEGIIRASKTYERNSFNNVLDAYLRTPTPTGVGSSSPQFQLALGQTFVAERDQAKVPGGKRYTITEALFGGEPSIINEASPAPAGTLSQKILTARRLVIENINKSETELLAKIGSVAVVPTQAAPEVEALQREAAEKQKQAEDLRKAEQLARLGSRPGT